MTQHSNKWKKMGQRKKLQETHIDPETHTFTKTEIP